MHYLGLDSIQASGYHNSSLEAEPPDLDSVPADIVFGEAFQASCQSIAAINVTIWIGEELGDQGWCILTLRKEYLGSLDNGHEA